MNINNINNNYNLVKHNRTINAALMDANFATTRSMVSPRTTASSGEDPTKASGALGV